MFRLTLAVALLVALTAQAQTYPTKPIRLVVPFAPGGSSSIIARSFAAEMEKGLGQSIIIDNRGGGGGNVAMAEVARAEPDGYTLIIGHIGTLAVNPFMYDKLPFDTNGDFAAVSLFAKVPQIFVVHSSVPAKDLREFVALAKQQPGKLYYGSAGNGSAGHLAIEYFKLVAGIDIVHVPYKGTAPAEADLAAGHISLMLDTTTCLPFVASGRMRALAVASKKRNPALPDVPTFDEVGLPGIYASSWYGLMAPAGTPRPIIDKLNAQANEVLQSPDMKRRMAEFGAEVGGGTPEDFGQFIASEIKRYESIVRLSGAKLD
jgi:tripartite-type tricarboxylate transporter receptor subunit TctC